MRYDPALIVEHEGIIAALIRRKENEAFFTREMIPYYTQCEVAVGTFFPSIRLGFNPGELLDFILGWTTIDIFRDDLEKDEPVGQEE